MARFKIYVDEDAMDSDLVAALRSRGVTVVTASDAGMVQKPDEEHLACAAAHGAALLTFNVADFCRLHAQWSAGRRHQADMIVAQQQRYSIGEMLRRIMRLRASVTAESMRNSVAFLSNWG